MLLVAGDFEDLVHRLFQYEQDGRITFGMASTPNPVSDLGCLSDWTEFGDYIMEGGVRYSLRVSKVPTGLALECRLKGMNRDKYVGPSLIAYIRWAGLESVHVENHA